MDATPDQSIEAQAAALNNLQAVNTEFSIRQDPAKYSAMISSKLKKIQDDTLNTKRNAFSNLYNDLGRHFDMENNAINSSTRNDDLVKLNQYNLDLIQAKTDMIKYNKDLSRRQVEINDWYYQDKLETLFFMQMFFMTLLSLSIIFYFQKAHFINSSFAAVLTFVLLLIVTITGLYRYTYTSTYRDSRWWYKRRFAKPIYVEQPPKCGCVDDPFVPKKTKCPAKQLDGAGNPRGKCMSQTTFGYISNMLDNTVSTADSSADSAFNRIQTMIGSQTSKCETPSPAKPTPSTCSPPSAVAVMGEPGSSNVVLNTRVLPYV
jgi:hypothetical protein